MIKYLLWLLKGKPMVHYTGFNCGCCGAWYDKEYDIPEYKSFGFQFDTWGLCPKGYGCSNNIMVKDVINREIHIL
jgi:hypothetical protein